jgi:hypothetical protein
MSRPIFWTCETRVEPLLFATAAAFFFGDNLLRRPIDWRDAELAPLDFRQQQVCAFLRGLPQETMAADRSNVCRYMAADVLIVSKQRFISENREVHGSVARDRCGGARAASFYPLGPIEEHGRSAPCAAFIQAIEVSNSGEWRPSGHCRTARPTKCVRL